MSSSEEPRREGVISEQDRLKLLGLENEFYRSCNVIRQNGVELQRLRTCLVQEMLDLEVRKRLQMDQKLTKRIEELQVVKSQQDEELTFLKQQLLAFFQPNIHVRKKDKKLAEGAEAENTTGEQLPLPDAATVPSFSPVEVENTTAIHETEPPYQECGRTSGSSGTSEGDRTRHEQAITARQPTTSSSKMNRGELEVQPPRQHERGGKTAGSLVVNDTHSDHADENASIAANHKLRKRKHQNILLSSEDEAPSQAKKARNHVSKSVLLDTAGTAPKNKVQKPVRRRKKVRSVIPRALRKPKPNNTVKSHSQSSTKPTPSSESSLGDDRKRPIESKAHQSHSNVAIIRNNGAFSEAYMLTNPNPHKLRGISPEIPLQSDSSTSLLNGNSAYVSSDTESNSGLYKPSSRMLRPYDSESSQTDEFSESYSEEDWKPAKLKKKKSMRQNAMKAAGLVIDDILKIRRKQSSRTVVYDCIGSPKVKKGAHSPKRRLSLITRDAPKAERWSGPSTRKSLAISPDFFGSPGTHQTRSENTSATLMQVNFGGSNKEEPLVRKRGLPSTDSSTDEQDSSAVDDDTGGMSRHVSKATWLKKLPKRQLTVQLDKEVRISKNYDARRSPKPLSVIGDLKSREERVLENGAKHKHEIAQRMLSQQSGEPLAFATLNSDKDTDSHTSDGVKNSSKQNMIPSSDEDLEDTIVDVLGVDSVDEDNTRTNYNELKQNLTRIKLTDADFTAGDSSLEDDASGSSGDDTKKSSKQNGRLSDDDMQEPIDVLGVDDTTSNTENEANSERGESETKLNFAQMLKPTLVELTDADLTTESSLLQEGSGGGEGTSENIEDSDSSTKEPGERCNSTQTPKFLTGKDIYDILAAVSTNRVGTVVTKGDDNKKRKQSSKPVLTKKRRAIDQSSFQNVRVVLDALPVSRSPIGKAAVIVNCDKPKTRNKEGMKKKLKAGATGNTRGHSVGDKTLKRTKAKISSKPPSKRKKVAKQMEDDADDIVVKDLVEANSEDYRVKLKLVSKQTHGEKKLSTKPTRFKPLSGPLGIASSTEDDDSTGKVKKSRRIKTTQHTSEKKAAKKKLATKQVGKEGEGSGMEIDVIHEGSVSEKVMQTERDIMTRLSQNHHSKSSESIVINATEKEAAEKKLSMKQVGKESEGSGKEIDIVQEGFVSGKTMQTEGDIMTRLPQNHHSKTIGVASSESVVINATEKKAAENNLTMKQVGKESEGSGMEIDVTHVGSVSEKAMQTEGDIMTRLPQSHHSKTIHVGVASSESVVINATAPQVRSLEEHNYSKADPKAAPLSQNQEEHHSKTVGEASWNAVVTSPITHHQPRNLEEHNYSKTTPSLTQNLEEHHDKTVGEASSKSVVANPTTDLSQVRTEQQNKTNPTTAPLLSQILLSKTTSEASLLSQILQSKTMGEASVGTDSTTGQPHSLEEHSYNRETSPVVMTGPLQNHQSKTTRSESTVTNLTTTQVSQNQKKLQSKTNPTTTSSLKQNLEECHSKTVGEASSKSATATNIQVSQNKTNPSISHLSQQIQTESHSKTFSKATCVTTSEASSSRNTMVDSLPVVGGASVTMTTSGSTSTAEDKGSMFQPKKRRTTLLNRTKASSGFQLSVVEEKKDFNPRRKTAVRVNLQGLTAPKLRAESNYPL